MSFLSELQKNASAAIESVFDLMPDTVAENIRLRAFSLLKIPMVAFLGPKILQADKQKVVIKIPLSYRSKNHLNSMYFGALAVGADLVVGVTAMRAINRSGRKISLVFKDFHAEYTKRAEGDVQFVCEQAEEVAQLVQQAIETQTRVEKTFEAFAIVPEKLFDEPVAKFKLTLSLKCRD